MIYPVLGLGLVGRVAFSVALEIVIDVRGVQAHGTVVAITPEGRGGQSLTVALSPAVNDVTEVRTSDTCRSDHHVGDVVSVEYDPQDPTNARLAGYRPLVSGPALVIWAAALAFGVWILSSVIAERRRRIRRKRLRRMRAAEQD